MATGRHRTPPRHRTPRRHLNVWSAISRAGQVVTVLMVVVAASTVLGLAWVNSQHQQVLIVSSGSMAPTFNPGDAVIVAKADPAKLRVGDVVTFRTSTSDQTTTHRIAALKPGPSGLFFQTKGDGNATPDPNFVAASNLTGVMTGSVAYLGYWLAFFTSPWGRVLILGTPLLLILIAQTVSLTRDWIEARQARAQPAASVRPALSLS